MWILIAICAASFQTVRNTLARSIVGQVSPALNSWARFAFNLPFSAFLLLLVSLWHGSLKTPAGFYAWCFGTAAAQLVGNVALVSAFRRSSFAESIVLHKLEVVFAALIGALFFAEAPSPQGWAGVLVCGAGVLLINLGRDKGLSGWRKAVHFDLGALQAISSGILLVLTSFFLKEATAMLVEANPQLGDGRFQASVNTLFHTVWMQVALVTAYLVAATPGQLSRIRQHGKRMVLIGMASFSGSLCWFWAYSLAFVAYVKAVGQVELLYSVLISVFFFNERNVLRQLPGMALATAGILLVVWE
ncbi:MAG: DMT family transporter [Acidobacteriota bacterium]